VQSTNDPNVTWVEDDPGLATENLGSVMEALLAEFSGQLAAVTIIRHVVLASQQLLAAGVVTGLGPAAGSLAGARLRALATPGGAE